MVLVTDIPGCTPVLCWMYTSIVLDVHQYCAGCTPVLCWMYTSIVLDVHQYCAGCRHGVGHRHSWMSNQDDGQILAGHIYTHRTKNQGSGVACTMLCLVKYSLCGPHCVCMCVHVCVFACVCVRAHT